jgi:DnaJ-class molecular chaperone
LENRLDETIETSKRKNMMNGKDYYQILGVESEAASQKIKEAYRRLALQYHPDRNTENPSAVEKMKEINEAYAVLSDPRKRANYDAIRQQYGARGYDRFRENYSEQDIFRGSDINQVFEEMSRSFGFRGFEDVFRESYGQGYRSFEFRRPGVFGRVFVYSGPGFRRSHRSGTSPPSQTLPGYQGKLVQYILKKVFGLRAPEKGKDWHDAIHISPRDARPGNKIKYFHRRRSRDLAITLPETLRDGLQIRLRGMGAEGQGGGEPGDLYIKVRIGKPFLEKAADFVRNMLAR